MNRIVLSKSLVYSIILWSSIVTVSAQVSQKIGGNPGTIDPKAVLELESTTKGFLLPRMTAVQVAAIANPTSGMIVFCTDCGVGADGELRISYNGVWQTYKGNVTGDITGNAATVTTNANLSGPITSSGNTTSVASQTGTGSTFVMDTSPTLVTPVLGVATATSINNTAIPDSKTLVVTTDKLNVMAATSSSELAGVISDETGTGSVVLSASPTFTGDAKAVTATAGDNDVSIATTEFVTSAITTANATNANLTGAVTSTGNTTSLGSFTSANLATALSDETGSGVAVLATSPTLVTPVIGAATGTSLSVTGQLTSTVATGTAPLVVTSTTPVANLSIGGNAATVTTNANLTGVVTSTGNATAIADGALSIAKTNGLQTAIDGKVADAINDATTTVAPSQNAVFDALALKANLASPTFTGSVTAPIYASTPQALTDAATISWNPTNGLNASVTLGGNRALSFTSLPAVGSYGTLIVTQDGTGNRTITLPTTANKVLGSASTTTIALSSAAGAKDILNFYYDGTNCYWNVGQGYGTDAPAVITNMATNVTGTLAVANGGTGAATLTGLVKGNGTGAMTAAVAGTDYVAPSGSITGNAATVTTNANLSGPITSSGNTTSVASQTGTGSTFVMNTSPTLVTPVLGAATATSINSTTIPTSKTLVVTTDKLNVMAATSSSELAGVISDETGTGSVVLSASPTFTGDAKAVTATAGDNDVSIATTEFVTSAITTANATNANLTGVVTSTGNATAIADGALSIAKTNGLQTAIDGKVADAINDATTTVAPSQNAVFDALALKANLASPTFTGTPVAPTAAAGTNTTQVATTEFVTSAVTTAVTTANATNANLTGMVTSVGNATTVVTNANLSGAVTSIGNTTSLGSFTSADLATALSDETGSGVAVLATSPTLVTPVIGAATGTSLSVTGQLTSTVATGTAPLVVTSTTPVANLSIGGNAATVTTNANLTGVVTSTGNATAIADGALSIAKTNGLQTAIDGKVADAINDATTTVAPSQNAVFDALALKANLASPTFTGTPVAPTAAAGTNTTQVATTEFVTGAIATATIPDATTSAKGKIQLAGDLAGTADLPVVAANAITTSKILDANVTDAKIATVSGSKVTGNITGSAANITGTVAIANGGTGLTSVPANGQIDIGNGTGFTRATLTAGSGITITNNAGAITISAAVRPTTDQTIVTTAAQTSFTLSEIPVNAKVWMFINGVRTNNLAYSISGTTVTYTPSNNNSYELVVGDRIQFDYCY